MQNFFTNLLYLLVQIITLNGRDPTYKACGLLLGQTTDLQSNFQNPWNYMALVSRKNLVRSF